MERDVSARKLEKPEVVKNNLQFMIPSTRHLL